MTARTALRSAGFVLAVAVLAASGCSRETAVGHEFPVPVVAPLPQRVGLLLDGELRGHTHRQGKAEDEDWRVELGRAHASLFHQLFRGMFRDVVEVESLASGRGVVATFRPTVEDYQFSTPEESHTPYTEAWIRYRMIVYAPDGSVATSWTFAGYGRSRGKRFRQSGAIDDATRRAMRDAAAVAVLKLAEQPGIRAVLEGRPTKGADEG